MLMRVMVAVVLPIYCFGVLSACGDVRPHAHDDWQSLFDGKTLQGWNGAGGNPIGSQWQVADGNLVLTGGGGGDIITAEKFGDFELSIEWKISAGGNSGIFYRVADGTDAVWMSGMEYQVLDDERHSNGETPVHRAGAVYDLYAPDIRALKPVGEYNQSRILVSDGHVEHWLNGQKVVAYQLWSEDWNTRFGNSKFANFANFGRIAEGRIALQDHGDKVWYRNIKIRSR